MQEQHGHFSTTRVQSVGCESFQVDDFRSGPKGADRSRSAAREPLTGLAVICCSSASLWLETCSSLLSSLYSQPPTKCCKLHFTRLLVWDCISCLSFFNEDPGLALPSAGPVGLVGSLLQAFDPLCCLLCVSVKTAAMEKWRAHPSSPQPPPFYFSPYIYSPSGFVVFYHSSFTSFLCVMLAPAPPFSSIRNAKFHHLSSLLE